VGGYAPRAREDSVRPRRLVGASGRPLNFTVRGQREAPSLVVAPMRTFVSLLTVLAVALWLNAAANAPQCQGADLPQSTLLEVVKTHLKKIGGHPEAIDDNTRTRVEVDTYKCDYLVRVTALPEKPGGFTIYRISRGKRIVDILEGD
jgi:hypothetical protein